MIERRFSSNKSAKMASEEVFDAPMQHNAVNLTSRIQMLSPEQVAEVEDFIDFLRFRAQERDVARAAATMSESAFHKVWSNPEDDAYDAL